VFGVVLNVNVVHAPVPTNSSLIVAVDPPPPEEVNEIFAFPLPSPCGSTVIVTEEVLTKFRLDVFCCDPPFAVMRTELIPPPPPLPAGPDGPDGP
jgi:hypothetical protein